MERSVLIWNSALDRINQPRPERDAALNDHWLRKINPAQHQGKIILDNGPGMVQSLHPKGCTWRHAMEDADPHRIYGEDDEANNPTVTVGLAALALLLLSVVVGVLVLLLRG